MTAERKHKNPSSAIARKLAEYADQLVDGDVEIAVFVSVDEESGEGLATNYMSGSVLNPSEYGHLRFAQRCLAKAAEFHTDDCACGKRIRALADQVRAILKESEEAGKLH